MATTIDEAASEAQANLEEEMAKLRADLGRLRDDVGALTRALGSTVASAARSQGARVRTMVDDARSGAESILEDLEERGRAGVAAVEHQIEERPLTSILVAFGVGVLIAKLMDR